MDEESVWVILGRRLAAIRQARAELLKPKKVLRLRFDRWDQARVIEEEER